MYKRISLLLTIGILFSCKKDLPIIIGCTDSTALNYNSSATYNDGSCIFWIECAPTPYLIMSPSGFPNISIPENNPMTVEGIALGKKLFHDPTPCCFIYIYLNTNALNHQSRDKNCFKRSELGSLSSFLGEPCSSIRP